MRNGGPKEGIAVSDAAEESGVPKLTRKLKFLFWSVAFSTFCLVIRAVYRTIEVTIISSRFPSSDLILILILFFFLACSSAGVGTQASSNTKNGSTCSMGI